MSGIILRVDKVPDAVAKQLASRYKVCDHRQLSDQRLEELAGEIDVILASGESRVTAELINRLPALKLIAVFGVGYDGVDIQAATQRNIQVTNTPDVLTDDVADLGIGLMLATARQLTGAQRFIEQLRWPDGPYRLTTKVSGGRLGIVGFGRVGRAVAARAKGFAMSIGYFDRRPIADTALIRYAGLTELARNSDFLMVCASAGRDSMQLINHEVLAALGPQGILINIARGSVIDEQALVEAIIQGTIAGAGLDVFADEPRVPPALLQRDNVVLTPHVGSATHATRAAMARLTIDNITAFFAGAPLLTPVNQ